MTWSANNALYDEVGLADNLNNILPYLSYLFQRLFQIFWDPKSTTITHNMEHNCKHICWSHICTELPRVCFTILQNSTQAWNDSIAKTWITFSETASHQTICSTKDTFRERLAFTQYGCRQTQPAHFLEQLSSSLFIWLLAVSSKQSHKGGGFRVFFLLCFNFHTESNIIGSYPIWSEIQCICLLFKFKLDSGTEHILHRSCKSSCSEF